MVRAFDGAWVLLLASRSEGTPRVVIEAFCRGRASSAARAGGIPDLVADGETGLLVEPDRPDEIADALVRILSDRALAERLGAGGRARVGRLDVHARGVRRPRGRSSSSGRSRPRSA